MKNIRWTILAALLLAAPTAVRAQAPSTPGGPPTGAPGATTTTPGDTGTITNAAVDTTTTTTTTTSNPGIGPDGVAITDETMMTETTELANTGGEPLILSLMGLSMAAGAFMLRRRVTG